MRTFGRAAVTAIIALAALLAAPALADTGTGTIAGVVYSATTGGPIEGAKVVLSGTGASATATSDAHGVFTFSNLAPGTYSLRTTAGLYQPVTSAAIVVSNGNAVDLSVALQPVSTTEIATLGHVTVTGHQTVNTSTSSQYTISANTFVNTGTDQVETLLATTPGVAVNHFDNAAPGNVATISIRGAGGFVGGGDTGYEVLVLQDGEPVRNGEYGDDDISGLTPAIYSRVEVVKGVGGTSLFGANTIGGTVNFVTIDPKATEGGALTYSVGTYGTTDTNLALTNTYDRFGYVVDYHQYSTNGYLPTNLVADNPPSTSESSGGAPVGVLFHPTEGMLLHSGLAKLRYDLSGSTYAVLSLTDEWDWRDQSGLIVNPETVFLGSTSQSVANDPNGYPYFFGYPDNFVWNTDPKAAFDVHTLVGGGSLVVRYYDNELQRWADGNNSPSFDCCYLEKENDHLTGELATWEKTFGSNDVAIGIGGNGDSFDYGSLFNFETFVTPAAIPLVSGTQIEKTALLRDDDSINDKWDATFAGYYSDYNTLNVKRFDPRLGLVYKADQNEAIRFSAGSGFAAPTLSDIVTPLNLSPNSSTAGPDCNMNNPFCNATSGNPNLKEETAVGYDLGYERTWGVFGDFTADLYRTNLQNHIFDAILPAPAGLVFSGGGSTPTPVLGIEEPINIANSVYQGIELATTIPVTEMFNVKAYYNTQSAFPLNVSTVSEAILGDVVNNEQYLGVPLHKEGWSVNFQNGQRATAFVGADWFGQGNNYDVPPFWIYNAGISVPYSSTMTVHLNWLNIFNKNATTYEVYNGGVPYAGFNGLYLTNRYASAPHSFSVSIDERFGSLK